MSQATGNPSPPRLSSAFSRVPSNPYTARVQEAKENQTPAAVAQPALQPTQTVPPAQAAPTAQPTQTVPPAQAAPTAQPIQTVPTTPQNSVIPAVQPTQVVPTTQTTSVTPVVQPSVQPVATPTAPVSTVDNYLLQELKRERDQLVAALNEREQVINSLLPSQQELNTLKQQRAMQEALSAVNFAELESVDPEDAKKISASVLTAAQAPISALQKELEEQKKQIQQQLQQQRQSAEQQRINMLNQQVLAAHPDFFQLQNSPAYHAFMSQRDGLSVETRDQRAAREFVAGNTAYVIDLLNQMKGQSLDPVQIATVAPVQTATAAPVPAAGDSQSQYKWTLKELNDAYITGVVSQDEYKKLVPEARANFYQ